MATQVAHFDTGHTDTVHDSQFDYYGQRLVTCSSDGLVRVFSVDGEPTYQADLAGHQGPVWQVAWSHPKFGSLIASASFDHTVIVWKEDTQNGGWYILHRTDPNLHSGAHHCAHACPVMPASSRFELQFERHRTSLFTRDRSQQHAGSINSVCFAPMELGLIFAAASSDGNISVHTCNVETGEWGVDLVQNEGGLPAHPLGATCVSFAPALEPGAMSSARTRQVGSPSVQCS